MNLKWSNIGLSLSTLAVIVAWAISYMVIHDRKVQKVHYKVEKIEGSRDLISAKEIKKRMNDVFDLDNLSIAKINLNAMESHLENDNRVYQSEIHLDANREMHIRIVQRRPVVRIIDESGSNYYLDQEGKYVSKQDFKAIRVPVATGDIEPFDKQWKNNKKSKIKACFTLIEALRKDDFLVALVEQIHFENDRIVMIPKMSSERIIITDLEDLDRKLQNLKRFYQTEMTMNDAWGKYGEIDISIKNQVIRRPINP